MARFYANENFPLPVVIRLRELGHDVVTTFDAGLAGRAIPDEQVLEYARTNKRAVLTFNRKHFIRLHRASEKHTGIVVCSFDTDFTGLAHRISEAVKGKVNLTGTLIRVERIAIEK